MAGSERARPVPGAPRTGRFSGWMEAIRSAPVGVSILGVLLFFAGAGLVVGGVYLALARSNVGWMVWAAALVTGPVVLYTSLHLLRRASWAWLAMILLLVLLLLSSALRAVRAPGLPAAPLVEMAVETAILAYLARGSVRRAFGHG